MVPMADDPVTWPAHPFWDWSLAVYARPGVAAALLRLQDEQGLDVNLLLFCIWAAAAGPGGLRRDEVAAARAAVASWRSSLLLPLRALRRACAPGRHALPAARLLQVRQALQRAELDAEHAAQLHIAASLGRTGPAAPGSDPLTGAAAALRYLLALESVEPGPAVMDALVPVLAGCLPGVDQATAGKALRAAV